MPHIDLIIRKPDKNIIEETKRRLQKEKNITFIQAGVGEKSSMAHYDALGKGAGNISDGGSEVIQLVALDDYIMGHGAYVKMDCIYCILCFKAHSVIKNIRINFLR